MKKLFSSFSTERVNPFVNIPCQVPPLILPSWNQILSSDSISNLLSPTKNLLPAAANPLYPPISPYYPKSVIAPHPSELPLPSLSLTPKKKILADNQKKTATNARMHLNLASSENEDNIIDDDESSDSHSTSSKLCEYIILKKKKLLYVNQYKIILTIIRVYSFALKYQETMFISLVKGKRRLAAQFNQPIEP